MTTRNGTEYHSHDEPEPWMHPATTRSGPEHANRPTTHEPHAGDGGHRGHGLMMICCVPMIVIAVALVATGVAGSGAIVTALLCAAMMAAMMFAMPGGHGHK